jgi:hypothetical protein
MRLQHLGTDPTRPGTVTLAGNIAELDTGILSYYINFNPATGDNSVGKIEISVKGADQTRYVVSNAQYGWVDSAGDTQTAQNSSPVSLSKVGNTIVAKYQDSFDAATRQREHIFWLEGPTLRVRVNSVGTDLDDRLDNYNGFYFGTTDVVWGQETILMPGTLAQHITKSTNNVIGDGKTYFVGRALDPFQSHASRFAINNPDSVDTTSLASHTLYQYSGNTAGNLQGGLAEEYFVTISDCIEDCFVINTGAVKSQYFDDLSKSPLIMLSQGPAPDHDWSYYKTYFQQAQDDWGFDHAFVWMFYEWTAYNYNGVQQNGMTWMPAGGDTGLFQQMVGQITSGDMYFSSYTNFTILNPDTPDYDTSYRLVNSDGNPVPSELDSNNFVIRERDKILYMTGAIQTSGCLPEMQSTYGVNSVFYDVSSYGAPHKGVGVMCDMTPGEIDGTLSGSMRTRLNNFITGGQYVSGPTFGEGSLANWDADMEYLWAPALDGNTTWFNSNAAAEPINAAADKAISKWYAAPNYVWKCQNTTQTNYANLPARFFSLVDFELVDGNQSLVHPYTMKMMDRMRAHEFLLGRPGTIYVNQSTGRFEEDYGYWSELREHIKEYYITSKFVSLSRDRAAPDIFYWVSNQWMTFEQALAFRGNISAFVAVKIKIVFPDAHEVYINRSATDWENPVDIGIPITIPVDGFLSVKIEKNRLNIAASATLPDLADQRIDIGFMPGKFICVDGRTDVMSDATGVANVLGMDLPGGHLWVDNFTKRLRLQYSDEDGQISSSRY